jgi:hypothetical protein
MTREPRSIGAVPFDVYGGSGRRAANADGVLMLAARIVRVVKKECRRALEFPTEARTAPEKDHNVSVDISEFIDTYSDDLITLREGRIAMQTHPLRRTMPELCDASFARLLAVVMVGGIEMMLETWRERDSLKVLDTWFAEKASNGDRVQRLCEAFRQKSIGVDKGVFDDFLAIKYIRNTIIHSRWKPNERNYVESRNFPGDARRLKREHLNRMVSINQSMMFYIALTGIADAGAMEKIGQPASAAPTRVREEDVSGIVRAKDIPTIYWNNLDRISESILQDVYKATSSGEYAWSSGFTKDEVETLAWEEKKKLFYLSARRAGEAGYTLLVQHKEIAREGLEFWKEYWRLTFERRGITLKDMRQCLNVLRHLHARSLYPTGPFELPDGLPDELARQFVRSILPSYAPLTDDEVVRSLRVGKVAYETVPNIGVASLLITLLPSVDPENTDEYLMEGERALSAMELNAQWYFYVEQRKPPESGPFDFQRKISTEFMSRKGHNPGKPQ